MNKNKKGFTLIEIIVVIVILAVLLAVAVPAVLKYMDEADNAKFMTNARSINENTSLYINKTIINSSEKSLLSDLKKICNNLHYANNKDLESIVGDYNLPGYRLHSVQCYFDGLNDHEAWKLDKNVENHTVTKICLQFIKYENNAFDYSNSKIVVTVLNKKMIIYNSFEETLKAEGTEWSFDINSVPSWK